MICSCFGVIGDYVAVSEYHRRSVQHLWSLVFVITYNFYLQRVSASEVMHMQVNDFVKLLQQQQHRLETVVSLPSGNSLRLIYILFTLPPFLSL